MKKSDAERIAELMGNDGQVYKTAEGRTLDETCRAHGAAVKTRQGSQGDTQIRYQFADGSAIVDGGAAWDIEGTKPWSWQGAESR